MTVCYICFISIQMSAGHILKKRGGVERGDKVRFQCRKNDLYSSHSIIQLLIRVYGLKRLLLRQKLKKIFKPEIAI